MNILYPDLVVLYAVIKIQYYTYFLQYNMETNSFFKER
jgi:hypothetical protein